MIDIEYESIKTVLKTVLKQKNLSYLDIAKKLQVSEITVKRFFSKSAEYNSKMFDICEVAQVSFFELVEMAKEQKKKHFALTQKQDRFFAKNLGHFAIFRELYRKRPISYIKKTWKLNEADLFKVLFKLEKIGLIEVQANNEVKIIPEGVLELDRNTELEIKLRSVLTNPFLKQFEKPLSEEVFYHNSEIEMSQDTKKQLMQELHDIIGKYCTLGLRDKNLLSKEKLVSVRWLYCFSEYETCWKSLKPVL